MPLVFMIPVNSIHTKYSSCLKCSGFQLPLMKGTPLRVGTVIVVLSHATLASFTKYGAPRQPDICIIESVLTAW